MSELIELTDRELDMVAGGQVVGSINVLTNVSAVPQVAIATAVLTTNSIVSARNAFVGLQANNVVQVVIGG